MASLIRWPFLMRAAVEWSLNDRHRSQVLDARQSLGKQLISKSRSRSELLRHMAQNALAPDPLRNDLTPRHGWNSSSAAVDLVVPARNVRKIEPAHLREIATSISSLGFCDPILNRWAKRCTREHGRDRCRTGGAAAERGQRLPRRMINRVECAPFGAASHCGFDQGLGVVR